MRPLALPLLETPAVSAKLPALAGQYKLVVLREVLGMEDGESYTRKLWTG